MGIIYVLSVVILFISYMLIKKADKKVDILKQIALTIVLLFCYNTFICYVLTFFTISSSLLNLSIINYVFSIIIIIYLVKTKKIQKFCFKKIDLLYISLLAIATIGAGYLNFGFPFEIKYETGDPATHYLTSELFKEQDTLLANQKEADEVFGIFDNRKTVSYVNSGLIMKLFENVIDSFDNYKIFILFGMFILFLSGWMFYSTISRFAKDGKTRFLAFIVSLLYMMGYPLNSMLFGFEYLSMGILIISAIIASIDVYQKEEIGYKQNLIVFFLLNFGVFCAYYMFVPFVYSGLWIYFCINEYRKNRADSKSKLKSLFNKKLIIQLLVTLLIPFLLGYIYHIAPEIYGVIIRKSVDFQKALSQQNKLISQGLAAFGYIYVNLFSNILPLIPFVIIAMYKNEKENKGVSIITILAVVFIIILFIGHFFQKVSIYYLSKNYYAIWLLLYYLAYKGLLALYEENKIIPFAIVATYIIAIVVNLLFFETNISHGVIDREENILQVADIYGANKTIYEHPKDLNLEEIEILKMSLKMIPEDSKTEIAGDIEQGAWAYSMTRIINDDDEHTGGNKIKYKMMYLGNRVGKIDYLVYFNRGEYYQFYKEKLWENAEVVFENGSGGILKYNIEN